MKHILLTTCITIFLSACSQVSTLRLYSGPSLDPSQEATIKLPESFDIIKLYGQEIPKSQLRFRTGITSLSLPSGEHTLILQYNDFWQIDDDNHDTVSSGPITFKLNMAPLEVFSVQHTPLNDYQAAIEFVKQPEVFLTSQHQKSIGSHSPKNNPLILISDHSESEIVYPNLQQLKFWWNRATYYEQNEFIAWKEQQSAGK